jgi:anaerobic ribonucleoside-triphosphate reductase
MSKEIKIPAEVYSRVVGFYRPVSQWNKGKKEEFNDRKEYSLKVHSSEEASFVE